MITITGFLTDAAATLRKPRLTLQEEVGPLPLRTVCFRIHGAGRSFAAEFSRRFDGLRVTTRGLFAAYVHKIFSVMFALDGQHSRCTD